MDSVAFSAPICKMNLMTSVASWDFFFVLYFLILGNVIVLLALIHSNPYLSNFPIEVPFLMIYGREGILPLGGLAAYLKVVRKLLESPSF